MPEVHSRCQTNFPWNRSAYAWKGFECRVAVVGLLDFQPPSNPACHHRSNLDKHVHLPVHQKMKRPMGKSYWWQTNLVRLYDWVLEKKHSTSQTSSTRKLLKCPTTNRH